MAQFLSRPLNWLFLALGALVAAMTAFVVFQPVQVIPRLAYGPEYELIDQNGQPFTDRDFQGRIVLYGFGYTSDPTDIIIQTLTDMQDFQRRIKAEEFDTQVALALILFDNQRDTPERRQAFAGEHGLDLSNWVLLSGDAQSLKRVIGQGFGVYYEAVPLADLLESRSEWLREDVSVEVTPDAYGFLQAQRYILVDERNIIRAEYRAPLDVELAMRDIRYIIREKNSKGVSRALNEAAHLFLCYPQ
ncbi:MAG TPA: SCO family protein [Chloroflexi bacterium]|nr:SCO family protein [Chloroflexota bacterium]